MTNMSEILLQQAIYVKLTNRSLQLRNHPAG